MYSYSLSQWILFYLFYCVCGWCIETTFVSCRRRRFVNRGFLRGPVIPLYGSGAIVILFVALPVQKSLIAVFFLGGLAATALEYVTGAAMEAVFKVRYWDYTENRCNLNGYICLGGSVAWCFLSVLLVRVIHRPVESLVLRIPDQMAGVAALVLSCLFAADLTISLRAAVNLRQLLEQLHEYSDRAREEFRLLQKRMEVAGAFRKDALADRLADSIRRLPDGGESLLRRIEAMEQAAERLEQNETVQKLRTDLAVWKARRAAFRENLRQRMTWDQRLMLRDNPTARSKRYAEQWKLISGKEEADEEESGQ